MGNDVCPSLLTCSVTVWKCVVVMGRTECFRSQARGGSAAMAVSAISKKGNGVTERKNTDFKF